MNIAHLRNSTIRTDEPSKLRTIVPAVEVVQPRFGVVIIPPVAEWILFAHGVAAGVGDGTLAPGVVAVLGDHLARGGPHDGDDIPLHVVKVIIQRVPVGEAHPLARAVVEEQHGGVPGLLRQNLAAVEDPPQLELFYSAIPSAFMAARNSAASLPALAALVASIVYQEYSKS